MKRTTLLSIASLVLAAGVISVAGYGCGDDDNGTTPKTDGGPTTDSPAGDTSMNNNDSGPQNPAPPTLGAQIDRMGRPAINTALNSAFELNATTKGQNKDKYNQDNATAGWGKAWIGETSKNLAILDSLDTNCGNQFLSTGDAAGPATSTYGALGGVAADDRLWIKTDAVPAAGSTTACTTYLAVEANFAVPALANADCGGRALDYDVIDVTYSAAAIGATSGVGDGIAKDDVKTSGNGTATAGGALAFPYLAPPLQ